MQTSGDIQMFSALCRAKLDIILLPLIILLGCQSGNIIALNTNYLSVDSVPNLLIGQSAQLTISISSTRSTTAQSSANIVWISSTPSIASVDTSGIVTCLTVGQARIIVSSEGLSSSALITCMGPASLQVSPATLSLQAGISAQASATALSTAANSFDVTTLAAWQSTSAAVTVTNTGVITCISSGNATLTASYYGISSELTVICTQPSFHTDSFFREASDEFVGPFSSWVNVKTAYGAVGDGQTDDTAALQTALNSLDASSDPLKPVLWIPAGNYKVSQTLTITHKQFFSIIGEDPRTTTISWSGAQHGTILRTDASTWFRISRLSFDGRGIADTAEDLDSTNTGGYYSTFNDLSDQHIKGVLNGILLPVDAETTIERIFFDHIGNIGVDLQSFNTLNIFISDSLFIGCGTGVSNLNGAGNFIVSNSFFSQSTVADMSIYNTGYFTARHNTSVGSAQFFAAKNAGANPAIITLQNNTILDPVSTPFYLGNIGPLMLIDNTVRMQNSNVPYVLVNYDPSASKDLFSIGNAYTPNAGPVTSGGGAFWGQIDSYDDNVVSVNSIPDVVIPSNVYVPPNENRTVYEVADFTGDAIQDAINRAVNSDTGNPVVHLKAGHYNTNHTISIPEGSIIQVVGDDPQETLIVWTGTEAGPMLAINSSNATVRNLGVMSSSPSLAEGIVIAVDDQPDSQVIVDEAELQAGLSKSVVFDGIEHVSAELFNTYTLGSVTGISAIGGSFRGVKHGAVGVTNHYSGSCQSSEGSTSFDVSKYGKLMIQDNWHDSGGSGPYNFKLSGGGTLTEQTGVLGMLGPTPYQINNFDGNVSLIGLQITGGFSFTGGQSITNILTLGLVGDSANYLVGSTGGLTVNNILDSYINSTESGHIAYQNSASAQWMRMMLAETRTEYPLHRLPLVAGANRIRLMRIAVRNAKTGIHIVPKIAQTGGYYSISNAEVSLGNVGQGCSSGNASNSSESGLQWTLMAAGDGDYEIISVKSNLVLSVQTEAMNLAFALPTGGYEQRWLVQNNGDGTFQLRNRATGLLLSGGANCTTLSGTASAYTNWTLTAH
jgi:hypothetical protein